MQPLGIPINSPINTDDDGLLSQEPSFDYKNSLVYKGIASNTTVKNGDGILSTTGKEIKYNGYGNVTAGDNSFNIFNYDEDYYTVENSQSKEISKKEVAIGNVSADVSDIGLVLSNGHVYIFNNGVAGNAYMVTPVQNVNQFAAFTYNDSTCQLIIAKTDDPDWAPTVSVRFNKSPLDYQTRVGTKAADFIFGEKMTAAFVNDRYIIGFDDDDLRRRAWLVYIPSTGALSFHRGFGCVGTNGVVYGEPLLYTNYEWKTNTWNPDHLTYDVQLIGDTGVRMGAPDWYRYPDWFKVLPNGKISVWVGVPHAYSLNSHNQSPGTNYFKMICDQNAQLGASLTDLSSTQAGQDSTKWLWKLHCADSFAFGKNGNDFALVQEYNEGSVYYNSSMNGPRNGERYWYTSNGWSEEDYADGDAPGRQLFYWHLSSADIINLYSSEEFICQDNYISQMSAHPIVSVGDWTYQYDSMKNAANTSDYDAVFPFLRFFMNDSSARGKYWDYDNTGYRALAVNLGWMRTVREISVMRSMIYMISTDHYRFPHGLSGTSSVGYDSISYNNIAGSLTSLQNTIYRYNYMGVPTEPIGRLFCCCNDGANNNYNPRVSEPIDYLRTFEKALAITGNKIHAPYDGWIFFDAAINDNWSSNYVDSIPFKLLKIIGDGAGLEEETLAFGGMGDDSLLSLWNHESVAKIVNYATNKYNNRDTIRQINYSDIGIGLSYKGTLLFNATALDNQWHVWAEGDTIHLTLYVGNRAQSVDIVKNGNIVIDKLTDYMYRINLIGGNNLLTESRNGIFTLQDSFKSFLGDWAFSIIPYNLTIPTGGVGSNNVIFYGSGINSDLTNLDVQPSFLLPAVTINSYVQANEVSSFISDALTNRGGFIRQRLRWCNEDDPVDVYYTSSNATTDVTYKETDKLPSSLSDNAESYIGVQSQDNDKNGTSYWIDSSTVIYPIGISTEVSGVNYQVSTIELPDNYAVRFYNHNNLTWGAYNQNAAIWFGQNIFTIMGSNYYFDKQGIYYTGNESGGALSQYSENTLVAYAIGMEYLCNAPSEAYFYSPFDRSLYIFTPSNTLQKSTSLARYGELLDSCYCPVNQGLYLLFDGVLVVKTQNDMASFTVTGDRLFTTVDGVQVADDSGYVIHHPYKFGTLLPLDIETEWMGSEDGLFKFSYIDVVLRGKGDVKITTDFLTINGVDVSHNERELAIKAEDWHDGYYRMRVHPSLPVGNAFKLTIKSDDPLGVYTITSYQEQQSIKQAAQGAI